MTKFNVRISNSNGTYALQVNTKNQVQAVKKAEKIKSNKTDLIMYVTFAWNQYFNGGVKWLS